jgi:predicted metal-dependent phosphoesterase TrpH
MGKVDLHIHTTASDGKFTPAEIVRKAAESGLTYIAICDHDSAEGIPSAQEAARDYPGLTVIAGVEINTDIPDGELHVLGYSFDTDNLELKMALERLRSSRVLRAQKMINKLRGMGIRIDFERVQELAGTGAIGRPHIAQAMLEKGYINNYKEAFLKYIGRGGPAYVEREKITPVQAVQLILKAGGVPVLAHPMTMNNYQDLINELTPSGLLGLEVYYNSYSQDQIQELLRLSAKYDLLPTGGSDFHGLDVLNETPLGMVEVPLESALRLIELAEQQREAAGDRQCRS